MTDDSIIDLPINPSPAETEPGSLPSRRDDCPVVFGAVDADDQHPVAYGHPEPAMQQVSEREYRHQMGHPSGRPDKVGITSDVQPWISDRARTAFRTQPDADTVSAIKKIAKFWNGEPVAGNSAGTYYRLLAETPPKLDELLSQAELQAVDPIASQPAATGLNQDAVEAAFRRLPWFEIDEPNRHTILDVQYIAGMKRRYHVTPYGKEWIEQFAKASTNNIPEPQWEGGLVHRYGTGLFVLFEWLHGVSTVATYHDVEAGGEKYNVDVYSEGSNAQGKYQVVGEVIGRHNNRTWDAETYRKTSHLSAHGYIPVYLFATLDRAISAIRKWQQDGLLDIDRKIQNVGTGELRDIVADAYRADPSCGIRRFYTVREMRKMIFEESVPVTRLDSLNW
jgi:hypothetical protein